MTRIDVQLLVALKGADLTARTAELALVDKMGYRDRLLGLSRFDYFRLEIDSSEEPERTVAGLERILGAQSTFYNRNKHVYSLACRWPGGGCDRGVNRAELRSGWLAGVRKNMENQSHTDLDGKESSKRDILNNLGGFLVEVLVEDDDQTARDSIAAKIGGGLAQNGGTVGVEVRCLNRATIWWLAIYAPDTEAAEQTAREIAVTRRRESGLLMNPNYQRVDFVSTQPIAAESR